MLTIPKARVPGVSGAVSQPSELRLCVLFGHNLRELLYWSLGTCLARSGAHSKHAAAVPLFERLTDHNPEQPREPQPLRTLSYPELLRSVQREVARLLNIRSGHTTEELLGQSRSTINYGVSDLLWVNPLDPQSLRTLVRVLEESIEAFEPRLQGVRLTILRFVQTESRLVLKLAATLITEDLREPVSFQVTASARTKEVLSDDE